MKPHKDDLLLGLDDAPNHDETHFANELLNMHQRQQQQEGQRVVEQQQQQQREQRPTPPVHEEMRSVLCGPPVSALGMPQERPSGHGLLRQKN